MLGGVVADEDVQAVRPEAGALDLGDDGVADEFGGVHHPIIPGRPDRGTAEGAVPGSGGGAFASWCCGGVPLVVLGVT